MPIPGARYRVVETSKGEDKKRRKASADGYASNPARRVR